MAAAPMLGGYLNYSFGFRSNFLTIALFVAISLIVCLCMFEETLPAEKRLPLKAGKVAQDFKRALLCLPFWQVTIVTSVIFGGYIAFLSGSSVLFVVELGVTKAIFPFIQAAILGGWVIGSLTLNRSIAKWGTSRIKHAGIALTVLGGVVLGVVTLFAPRDPYLLTAGMVLYSYGANWIIGLYFPECMEILPDIKGVTSSLLTSTRLMIAALIVALASALYNGTVYPLTGIILGTVVILLPILMCYEKKRPAKVGKHSP